MRPVAVFWFRRDLRLEENTSLYHALRSGYDVLPIFIFDTDITDELPSDDPRLGFIYEHLSKIHDELRAYGSGLMIKKGKPLEVWKWIIENHKVKGVFANKDYEPYALKRDQAVAGLLDTSNIPFHSFKDHVIFEESEVVKQDGKPYTVYTPYKKQWLRKFDELPPSRLPGLDFSSFLRSESFAMPGARELDISESKIKARPFNLEVISGYDESRDFPYQDKGSYLGPFLRSGIISIRKLVQMAASDNETFLSELIWREFFAQILYHFPDVVDRSFKPRYDDINWINNEQDYKNWCDGKTGYPMVDAGMRELNQTGYMHNRVRMVTASFLCKHLLIDWRWGEAYFARKLMDYELASNNGNWQWAAGTGCDAAPYFRIFNPIEQQKKFDSKHVYIKKWVSEFDTGDYPAPIVEHRFARQRALDTYRDALKS